MIHEAILSAMKDIEPIAKGRKNMQQSYNFRGIDDIYNELQPILAKHGIFTTSKILSHKTEDRTTKSGGSLIYRVLHIQWAFCACDGTSVYSETIGEGMDSGDKASNKAMAVAHKYALMQLFCIPTEDLKDPENDSHDVMPSTVSQCQAEIKKASSPEELQKVGETFKGKFTGKNLELITIEYKKRLDELKK